MNLILYAIMTLGVCTANVCEYTDTYGMRAKPKPLKGTQLDKLIETRRQLRSGKPSKDALEYADFILSEQIEYLEEINTDGNHSK